MSAPSIDRLHRELLLERDFVRQLARALVRDADAAEDLAQQAALRALEHPPRELDALRAWLARVVERSVARWRANEAGRQARERAVARSERTETDYVRERIETQQSVQRALAALDEPYRTALHLRYSFDHTPTQIAALLGVSTNTVKSRLTRGLALMRASLERESGRGDWRAPLWALAASSSRSARWLPPIAAAALLAAGLAYAWFGAATAEGSAPREQVPWIALTDSYAAPYTIPALALQPSRALPTDTSAPVGLAELVRSGP